ncbi:hypothetical protein CesoFtcFv8_020116 [Champsocephalus esox]|uniref:WH2 domain-containing protein n=1 Tax=Champsocephalus esox TaxID=159716 RepID=A0AAN8GLP8_9TELE|nr:hypothetical protein CesoFtcFv8_020116 [Champsocephalus esox]
MPVPPPPPLAPPPPPPPSAALPECPSEPPKLQCAGAGGRNALLADIQNGARLRKVAQVNDRSAPAVENPNTSPGDVSSVSSSGGTPLGPSLGGLFAGGFPTLRPVGQTGKTPVSRSSSSASLKPLWNPPPPPPPADGSSVSEHQRTAEHRLSVHRPLPPSSSAPTSPSHSSRHPPSFPTYSPPPPPPAPPSAAPPPPPPPQDRPANRHPPLPTCPPPPPPSQVTKPTWLPLQHSHHSPISQPSTPPPPPPPFQSHSAVPGDRTSGCFYPPPLVSSEPSRFPILRDSPLGPPPPPPPPPLPSSYTPTCPSTLPPPPPKLAAVPSPAMRPLPPSYPCNAPTRRPPAVPRSAGGGRLAPPPAPPARSPSTELSTRIPPPPPPPLPPSSLRNGHLQSLADDFESKFQFHPVEDFPPPEEFKPFPRTYPSKENRVNPNPPGIRTHLR